MSVDLRGRVVKACLEGLTYEEAASRFDVGYASVSRWLRLYRETKRLEPKPLPGRAPRIDEAGLVLVRKLVEQRADATLDELAKAYGELCGARLAPCIMHRALAKLGLTRKKRRFTRVSANATMSSFCDGTSSDFARSSDSAAACSSSTKAG